MDDAMQQVLEREKVARRRVHRTTGGASRSTDGRSEHTTQCAKCGKSWSYPVVMLGGHSYPARQDRKTCTDCLREMDREQAEAARAAKEREETEHARRLRSERGATILDRLAAKGVVTTDHGRCTLDGYDCDGETGARTLEAVRELLAETRRAGPHDPVRGLYLLGPTGSGKSHLAVAALRDLLLDPEIDPDEVVYDLSLELIGRIQDTYSSGESATRVLERRKRARVWILDDFGSENPSADVIRRLTEIFTMRAKRATIVTSNLDPNDLTHRNRDFFRLFSRFGPAYFQVVRVAGRDRRMDARHGEAGR